ncbi:nuclear transport factor 2 family protein [Ruegeria marisrubri]|nr:nuclear transport factor 2 family protein [Ruegeria marisrubri]
MKSVDQYSEIVATVRDYVEGMCNADAEKLRRVMHPKACSIGHFEGGLEWDDTEAFIAVVADMVENPDPDPWFRIKSIHMVGDMASVQIENYWLGMLFDDMLTLLKHNGAWMIVSKVFYQHPS